MSTETELTKEEALGRLYNVGVNSYTNYETRDDCIGPGTLYEVMEHCRADPADAEYRAKVVDYMLQFFDPEHEEFHDAAEYLYETIVPFLMEFAEAQPDIPSRIVDAVSKHMFPLMIWEYFMDEHDDDPHTYFGKQIKVLNELFPRVAPAVRSRALARARAHVEAAIGDQKPCAAAEWTQGFILMMGMVFLQRNRALLTKQERDELDDNLQVRVFQELARIAGSSGLVDTLAALCA